MEPTNHFEVDPKLIRELQNSAGWKHFVEYLTAEREAIVDELIVSKENDEYNRGRIATLDMVALFPKVIREQARYERQDD